MKSMHRLAPCAGCPFLRTSSYLTPARAAEIADTHLAEGAGAIFYCHETATRRKPNREHCAGAILFALANGVETLAMQIGSRMGLYQIDRIKGKRAVYQTRKEMVDGHDW